MKLKIFTKSAQETNLLGQIFARELTQDLFVALFGDLGSGKTTFVQGVAKGFKIKEKITSPSFVIIKKYRVLNHKKIKWFYHLDFYRIRSPKEALDLGFKEMISQKNAVIFAEWASHILPILPKIRLDVCFKYFKKNIREIIFKT